MYLHIKRIFGAICATLGLLVISPLILVIALAIKIDSKGPVFFKQGRLSKNGRIFQMYKFRTMVVNAESMGAGLFNYENDPRVTRVGRLLRTTSLDEIPQLLNVIKGDMALVGPRPPVTYELGDFETLNARYKKRFSVLPGITGLAQVSGRNELPWDIKVNFDNEYVDKVSLWLDIKILFLTVANVFTRKSIYEEKDDGVDSETAAQDAEAEIIAKAHAVEDAEKTTVI